MACHILGIPVSFLVDSRASCSLIDYSVFTVLATKQLLVFIPVEERFLAADGSDMTIYGQVKLTLSSGGQEYDLEVVVADLGCQSAILGLDFSGEQSTVLKVQSGTLLIDNEPVMLYSEQAQPGCNEILIDETLSIPPGSYRVVEVGVDLGTLANGMTHLGVGAVGGLSTLADIFGIVMDRGVVSVHNGKVPVNLINLHNSEIAMHRGKTIVSFQTVQSVVPVYMFVGNEGQDGAQLLTRADIPEFVTPVLEGIELTAEQESKACRMALQYPDEFKSPEGKNGQTEVTEHGID